LKRLKTLIIQNFKIHYKITRESTHKRLVLHVEIKKKRITKKKIKNVNVLFSKRLLEWDSSIVLKAYIYL